MSFWVGYGVSRVVSDLISNELASQTPREDDYLLPDERARQAASSALARDPELDAKDVSVLVLSGVLTLSGSVPSGAMKARAEQVCRQIRGVTKLENALKVV